MSKYKKKQSFKLNSEFFKKISIGLIAVSMLAVFSFAVYKAINTPEKVATDKIQDLTREYYEDYFYPKVKQSTPEANFENVMKAYVESGINNGRLTLRNVLFYDNGRNKAYSDELSEYCDLDETYAKIVPNKPYGKTDYHIIFEYSCNF